MHLLFKVDDVTTIRIRSHAGSWYAHLLTQTEVRCVHGEEFTIDVDFDREVTDDDSNIVLDAFEIALRASVAQTQEQKMQATEGIRQLCAVLTDEAVYFEFTDPCCTP